MQAMSLIRHQFIPLHESGLRIRFTKEEDERLKQLVSLYDSPNWADISKYMVPRSPRQCRERYNNYLRPNLINGKWTKEEDKLLNDLFQQYGPKWSLISQSFKSRSPVNVKNHYSSLLAQMAMKERLLNNAQSNESNIELSMPSSALSTDNSTQKPSESSENHITILCDPSDFDLQWTPRSCDYPLSYTDDNHLESQSSSGLMNFRFL